MRVVRPLATSSTESPFANESCCVAFSAGSRRMPASPTQGRSTSSIDGIAGRSTKSSHSPRGLGTACGVGGASSTSTISFGGSL